MEDYLMTSKTIKIEDNFLEQEKFDEIQLMLNPMADPNHDITTNHFAWYFRYRYYALKDKEKDIDELAQFQFTHTFYEDGIPQSPYMKQLDCFLELIHPLSILRITANLHTRLPTIVENPFHTDMAFLLEEKAKQWTTSIFYVNTNNGYTIFEDGTKVESVANRMITFPANLKHTGTSCTDQQVRIVINFDYFSNQQ